MAQTHSALAALSFTRGTATTVGCIQYSSTPDSVTIAEGFVSPGTLDPTLSIHTKRIQYDVINCDAGNLTSWTLYYSSTVGPSIIGALTPLGYEDSSGTVVIQGGQAYATLFNSGYGIYNYNLGAPWIIDYEVDHITFIYNGGAPGGLPVNAGVGNLAPPPVPKTFAFAVYFSPDLTVGLNPASATNGAASNGYVYGPLPGTSCISISASNIVAYTCSNCTTVTYNVAVTDTCCTNGNPTLVFDPPETNCFALGTTTPVTVTAYDGCGNSNVTSFTVTILPGPGCTSNSCLSVTVPNILAYTCSNCTMVTYNPTVTDTCCSNVTLVYSPPETNCFALGTTIPVSVTAYDDCGNLSTNSFTVTVLPDPNCMSGCISVTATNIVAYTCSNCTSVTYNPTVTDVCCSNVSLIYSLPQTYCFPLNTTTPVSVIARDDCGNVSPPSTFLVAIRPGPGCASNSCISVTAPNIVVFTCSNCTTVTYGATVRDPCCTNGNVTLVYDPAPVTCFPLNTTTPVTVTAYDNCGNVSAPVSFLVTVLPRSDCFGAQAPIGILSGGSGTNGSGFMLTWPSAVDAQLQQSTDLRRWFSVPNATNPPYAIPSPPDFIYFRLQYP